MLKYSVDLPKWICKVCCIESIKVCFAWGSFWVLLEVRGLGFATVLSFKIKDGELWFIFGPALAQFWPNVVQRWLSRPAVRWGAQTSPLHPAPAGHQTELANSVNVVQAHMFWEQLMGPCVTANAGQQPAPVLHSTNITRIINPLLIFAHIWAVVVPTSWRKMLWILQKNSKMKTEIENKWKPIYLFISFIH